MNERQKEIIAFIKNNKQVTGTQLKKHFNISRQAINKHLKILIEAGKIQKIGNTRGSVYVVKNKISTIKFKKKYKLEDIEEQKVFEKISLVLNLKTILSEKIFSIFYYSFTEILNNAIEHSYSQYVIIEIYLDTYNLKFLIKDYGIGIFKSIQKKYKLHDMAEAVRELLKGKTTTTPQHHSGEGIFFTSKLSDYMSISSHKIKLIYANKKQDIILEKINYIKGTTVIFQLSKHSKKDIKKIFDQYAPEKYDFKFDRTTVNVKLYSKEYMSRSEAKRLLSRLNKFREIILDFNDVKYIAQGFADEIFRVFKNRFPDIKITTINTNTPIDIMIRHVVDNKN